MQCGKDSPFESALFILRRGADEGEYAAAAIDGEMVRAASRLIEDAESGASLSLARPKKRKNKKRDRKI